MTWLDIILLAVVTTFITYVVYRAHAELHYRWNWGIVAQFIFRFDAPTRRWSVNLLMIGLLTTLRLAVWSAIVAAMVGIGLGLCRVSKNLFLRLVARAYVDVIRATPPLVIIFIFYFFVSAQILPLLGVESLMRLASPAAVRVVAVLVGPVQLVPAFLSAMFSLALFESAYIAEIVRAGIQSIDRGQWEAAAGLGLSGPDTMRFVVLPQAIQRVVPPLAGQFISLVKDSSIASLISVQELAFMSAQVSASTARVFETWITAALMYFGLCFGLAGFFGRLEKRMARGLQ